MAVSATRRDTANTHTVVTDTHTTVSEVRQEVADTHVTVSDTHTIVTDIHRNLVKSKEGAGGKNPPVSVIRAPSVATEQALTIA